MNSFFSNESKMASHGGGSTTPTTTYLGFIIDVIFVFSA